MNEYEVVKVTGPEHICQACCYNDIHDGGARNTRPVSRMQVIMSII